MIAGYSKSLVKMSRVRGKKHTKAFQAFLLLTAIFGLGQTLMQYVVLQDHFSAALRLC